MPCSCEQGKIGGLVAQDDLDIMSNIGSYSTDKRRAESALKVKRTVTPDDAVERRCTSKETLRGCRIEEGAFWNCAKLTVS